MSQPIKEQDEDASSFFEDGSFGDSTVVTHKGQIFGFNSYANYDKKALMNYHKYEITDFATQ